MKAKCILLLLFSMLILACEKTPDPSISIDGKTEHAIGPNAQVIQVKIVTNQSDWGYESDADWLKFGSPTAKGIDITVLGNDKEEQRSASVKFFAPKSGASAVAVLSVKQEGKPADPYFDVAEGAAKLDAPAKGGDFEIVVSTNQTSWGFRTDADWMTGKKEQGKLVLTLDENTVDATRIANIEVFSPDSDSYLFMSKIQLTQAPADIQYDETDLSKDGSSNSYIITHKGPYRFDGTVKGNGLGGSMLSAPKSHQPSSVSLLWQTQVGMIKSVSLDEDGYVCFEAGRVPGNAVIAVKDDKGTVLWSWHIWYPEVEVYSLKTFEGSELMNLNLGALSDNHKAGVKTFGMLYQWGRKDPFPGSPVAHGGNTFTKNVEVYDIDGKPVEIGASSMTDLKSNTLEYAISHPTVCISNNAQYNSSMKQEDKYRDWLVNGKANFGLWGNPDGWQQTEGKHLNKGSKTYFDPCPPGWRVPHIDVLKDVTSTGGFIWASGDKYGDLVWGHMFGDAEFAGYDYNEDGKVNFKDYFDGWYLTVGPDAHSYFPAATRYDGQYALLMGSMVGYWANYWYNSPSKGDGGLSDAMIFSVKEYNGSDTVTASGVSSGSRADAYSVRCIREK